MAFLLKRFEDSVSHTTDAGHKPLTVDDDAAHFPRAQKAAGRVLGDDLEP